MARVAAHRLRIYRGRSLNESLRLLSTDGLFYANFATCQGLREVRYANPELEADATGWGTNLASGVRDTSIHLAAAGMAAASYKVTTTNAASSGCYLVDRLAATPGNQYGYSIHIYAAGAAIGKQLRIVPHYYNASNVFLSAGAGPTVTLVAGWQRLTYVEVAPASTATSLLACYTPSAQGVFDFYAVGANIEHAWKSTDGGPGGEFLGQCGPYGGRAAIGGGYFPYMETPAGRRATFDWAKRAIKAGSLSIELTDSNRISATLAQNDRILSRFFGDSAGVPQLPGLRTELDYTEDVTGSETNGVVYWERSFTGRLDDYQMDGANGATLEIADFSEDLDTKIFVGRAHASATEAVELQAWPFGLASAYANFPIAPKMTGVMADAPTGGGKCIALDSDSRSEPENVFTEPMLTAGIPYGEVTGVPAGKIRYSEAKEIVARVVTVATGAVAEYQVGGVTTQLQGVMGHGNVGPKKASELDAAKNGLEVHKLYLRAIPGGTAVPSNGTKVEVSLRQVGIPPSDAAPLLINDCHAVTLIRYACQGYFSPLLNGAVTRTFTYKASTFTPLEADTTIPLLRKVKKESQPLREFIEEVCLEAGLGYRLNEYAEIELFDVRPPDTLAGLPALTDADCEVLPTMSHGRSGAYTQAEVTYYIDRPVSVKEGAIEGGVLSADGALLKSVEVKRLHTNFGRLDLGDKVMPLSAPGFRVGVGEEVQGVDRQIYVDGLALKLIEQNRAPFAYGPMEVTMVLKRNSTTKALREGMLFTHAFSNLVNPASLTRGGTRVARLMEYNHEDGLIRCRALDLGPNASLGTPSLSALAAETGNTSNGVQSTLTMNVANDPVAIEIARTTSAITSETNVPAGAWVRVLRETSGGLKVVTGLGSGGRIWMRARAEPGPTSISKVASAWVYPATTPYVDLTALPQQTLVSLTEVSVAGATLNWTNGGNTTAWMKLFLSAYPPYAVTAGMLSQSGLSGYNAANIVSGVLGANGWHTDSATPGAYLQIDLGAPGYDFNGLAVYNPGGVAGVYKIQYSDNGSSWTDTTVTAFKPEGLGFHACSWSYVGTHRYWRITLTNTPGGGAWLSALRLFGSPIGTPAFLKFLPPGTTSYRIDGTEEGEAYFATLCLFDGAEGPLAGPYPTVWTANGVADQAPKPLLLMEYGTL